MKNHCLTAEEMPAKLNDALRTLAIELAEELGQQCETYEPHPEERVEPVPFASCSGFVPFTDGGWMFTLPIASETWQDGSYIPAFIQSEVDLINDQTWKDAEEAARAAGHDPESEEGRDFCDEYAREGESVYWLDFRLYYYGPENSHGNHPGKGSLRFALGVNFDEYGREKYVKEASIKEFPLDAVPDVFSIKYELLKGWNDDTATL